MLNIDVVDTITEQDFINNYIKENKPVVVSDLNFDPLQWNPNFLQSILGDLKTQVYDTLFDFQGVSTFSEYLNNFFGRNDMSGTVPYIRWYNQLLNVDHAWGDEAFSRLRKFWECPDFLPKSNLLIPSIGAGMVDPTVDKFPYRGVLVAAKGARTRLHRDPFCSDAVVCQFYGKKEVIMYHPDRADELTLMAQDGSSFGGFKDVRDPGNLSKFHPEPDYYAVAEPGQIVYVPHGWLHDVLVVEDSLSITWNFIHEKGAIEYIDYLMDEPELDSEFEVLKYFYALSGERFESPSDILKRFNKSFESIELSMAE